MHQPETTPTPADTGVQLYAVRLLAYRIIVPIAALAIAIYWYRDTTMGMASPFDAVGYPVLFAVFGCSSVLLFVRPRLLDWLEAIGYVAFVGYNIADLYYIVFSNIVVARVTDIATIGLWFPFYIVITFAMLPLRRALAVTLAIYAVTIFPGAYLVAVAGPEVWSAAAYVYLQTLYIAMGLYIPLLFGIAVLKDRYLTVATRAETLARYASLDYLTNTANRRALDHELARAIALAQRHGRDLALILFDIDSFKKINDTHGHAAGDDVLIAVAGAVGGQVRGSDTLGRWGGEEFMVICPETTREVAALLAERLRALIEAQPILSSGPVTASFGVAACRPDDTVESLVGRADAALYRAKAAGRNRVELEG